MMPLTFSRVEADHPCVLTDLSPLVVLAWVLLLP